MNREVNVQHGLDGIILSSKSYMQKPEKI